MVINKWANYIFLSWGLEEWHSPPTWKEKTLTSLEVWRKWHSPWWCWKSSVNHIVFTCSRQHLQNNNKEDLVEDTNVVPAKYPPKVKLENFHNSRVLGLGKLCVPWFMRVFGFFYSSMGLTYAHWLRRSFIVGDIFFNFAYLTWSFPYGILLIRVNRGAQDISIYTHAWRPSKAMSDSSKVRLSPSASFRQLLISSIYSSCLVQVFVDLRVHRHLWGGTVDFILSLFSYERTSEADEFIRTVAFA